MHKYHLLFFSYLQICNPEIPITDIYVCMYMQNRAMKITRHRYDKHEERDFPREAVERKARMREYLVWYRQLWIICFLCCANSFEVFSA